MHTQDSARTQVDVLIHVNEPLDDATFQHLAEALHTVEGVNRVQLAPAGTHLVHVKYDAARTKAGKLLGTVIGLGHEAQLVGL